MRRHALGGILSRTSGTIKAAFTGTTPQAATSDD
jgi:hypothetical protein